MDADLGQKIDVIIDGGPCPVGVESTIVKVEEGEIRLLRPGGIDAEAIEAVTGKRVSPPRLPERPRSRPRHAGFALRAERLRATECDRGISVEALIAFGSGDISGASSARVLLNLSRAAI